ncbi:MAG TPA: hypothetical protein VIV60_08685 [Polyangiaceae bacterium]
MGACQDADGVPPLYLIDDFGDCDAKIITYLDGGDHTQVGRVGGWAAIGKATFTAGLPSDSSFLDQSCGVFVSGHCDNLANCNLGTYATLAQDGDTEYWYDLSRFGGFRVTYESNVPLDVTVVGTAIITKIRSSTAAVAGLLPTTAGSSTLPLTSGNARLRFESALGSLCEARRARRQLRGESAPAGGARLRKRVAEQAMNRGRRWKIDAGYCHPDGRQIGTCIVELIGKVVREVTNNMFGSRTD